MLGVRLLILRVKTYRKYRISLYQNSMLDSKFGENELTPSVDEKKYFLFYYFINYCSC